MTYHIVSHSHWDREWYRSFEQFRAMLVSMIDDLLDLLARDPSFVCFTLDGQAIVIEDYLEVRPEREREIREYVKKGRLLTGPWYILPDEFLVSAESTVRNLLTGIRTAERFGGSMKVGYIPDSFGHIAMMPAILRGFGIDTALIYRGFGGEPGQTSSEYWWTAPDGTRCLLLHLFRNGYSTGYFHQETDNEVVARFADLKAELDERAATSHRLLLNGGDHHWPDPKLPATLELIRSTFEGEYIHSSIPAYVQSVKKEVNGLPEVAGEHRFGYRYAFVVLGGVYSSRMYIKQANWRCQSLLERYVEPINALTVLAGGSSRLPLIRHAWRTLLQNHPHDSICGCSIDAVHSEMMTRFRKVDETGNSVIEQCLGYLIPSGEHHAGDDLALHFFNPSPRTRSDVVEATVRFYTQDIVVGLNPDVKVAPKLPPVRGFTLHDAQGAEVPYQIVGRGEGYDIAYSNYNYPKQSYADEFSILVDVHDAPSLGFTSLAIRKAKHFPSYPSQLRTGRNFIANDHLKVEVNARGLVTITAAAEGGRPVRFSGLHVLEDSGDAGDEYNYSYPKRDKWIHSGKSAVRVRIVEKGPLRAALRLTSSLSVPESIAPDRKSRSSRMVRIPVETTLSLTPSSRHVEIETTLENRARDHRLRVLFPTGIRTKTVLADSQFCTVERTSRRYNTRDFAIEHPAAVAPMQRFVTVQDGTRAFTLLSAGMPEYELSADGKGTLALTLLRCVGLLAGDNLITRPGGKAGWHNETPDAQCQGTHTFRYAVFPHQPVGAGPLGEINAVSEQFHYPLLAIGRKTNAASRVVGASLSIDSPDFVLSAFKESEDGRACIVRTCNPSQTPVASFMHIGRDVDTIGVSALDEREGPGPATPGGTRDIPLTAGPAGIITYRCTFTKETTP